MFFFNDTATTEIYTLSLHDALPISTMLVIGDVVGHDTEAAAAMGQLRGLLRGIAYRDGVGPAQVLSDLDAAVQGLGMRTMATAAAAWAEQRPEQRDAGRATARKSAD